MIYRNISVYFLIIIFLIFILPSKPAQSTIALAPIALSIIKAGISAVLMEAAEFGLEKAGKKIFKRSWKYAKRPVIKMVETMSGAIPDLIFSNESNDYYLKEPEKVDRIVINDPYIQNLIAKEFNKLTQSELDHVLLTLIESIDNKMNISLRNQATILKNQITLAHNQEIIQEKLDLLVPNENKIEGFSHYIDDNFMIELDYPEQLGQPKFYSLPNEYKYVIGIDFSSSILKYLLTFANPNGYQIMILDFEPSDTKKLNNSEFFHNYNMWKKFIREYTRSIIKKHEEDEGSAEIVYENFANFPERKYLVVEHNSYSWYDYYRLYFSNCGSTLNMVAAQGFFEEDFWEEYKTELINSFWEIKWSPINAELCFNNN